MARLLALDFGKKKTGVAVTDVLQITANSLATVPTKELISFLKDYLDKEPVETFIIGYPKQLDNTCSQSVKYLEPFLVRLKKEFPEMPIELVDERFTSKMAFQTLIDAGIGRKKRQDKELIDKISATIILQSYLEKMNYLRCNKND